MNEPNLPALNVINSMNVSLIEKIGKSVAENEKYHQTTGDQAVYSKFIDQFPVSSLTEMSLERYCMGHECEDDNFSWWLERGLQPAMGRYSPGTSKGHLIYKRKDGTYYKHRKLADLSDEQAMTHVAKIHHAIASTAPDDFLWLDNKEEIFRRADVEPRVVMGPGRVLRVLNMYHPTEMPLISSSDHLRHFLEKLGETDIPSNTMERLALYLQHYKSIKNQFDGKLTTSGFAVALYSEEIGIQPLPRHSKKTTSAVGADDELTDIEETAQPLAKNQILYGPPGTGKTYETKQRAVSLAEPGWYAELVESDPEDSQLRLEIVERYAELEANRRVVFTTIHQSFSYEDFVEGIRASTVDDSIHYEVEDGIFKQIALNAAMANRVVDKENELESIEVNGRRIWKMSLGDTSRSEDVVFTDCIDRGYAALEYGRNYDFSQCTDLNEVTAEFLKREPAVLDQSNFAANVVNMFKNRISISDLIIVSDGNHKFCAIGEVTGDYEFLAEEPLGHFYQARPVNWHRVFEPSMPGDLLFRKGISQMSLYELTTNRLYMGKLEELLGEQQSKSVVPQYVIILDEINRGNVSRIFGELITLLEPDKRTGGKDERQVYLPYSKKPFSVPANLHVVGTMNTADKSLAQIDLALRRRFEFVEVEPDPDLLREVSVYGSDLGDLLELINARIEVLLDRDHLIGHGYLWPVLEAADNAARRHQLARVFRLKLIPLLQEYFYSDWERIRWVLNDAAKPRRFQFITDSAGDKSLDILFDAGVASQLNDRRYRINEQAFDQPEAYQLIFRSADVSDAGA